MSRGFTSPGNVDLFRYIEWRPATDLEGGYFVYLQSVSWLPNPGALTDDKCKISRNLEMIGWTIYFLQVTSEKSSNNMI